MSSVEERFWEKVDKRGPDECWEWGATKTRLGYGQLQIDGRSTSAHRVSWELAYGPIPDGLCVCHHCDNPGCVNPTHLFLGTELDNARDRDCKGRQRSPRLVGERNGQAKLTRKQVLEIRRRYKKGVMCQRELGVRYGVTQSMISMIVLGKSWKHLEEAL